MSLQLMWVWCLCYLHPLCGQMDFGSWVVSRGWEDTYRMDKTGYPLEIVHEVDGW